MLPVPSNEQSEIIEKLADYNLIVDSVAGSGKTTLNLHLAQAYPDLNVLLLTYNARLKSETRAKATSLGLTNLEVHSYHSFAVKYYSSDCHTDRALRLYLQSTSVSNITDVKANRLTPVYDLIIIDEAQDLTPLYYQLVCHLYFSNPLHIVNGSRFCIVGDKYQSIYGFQNADPRMITLANHLFDFNMVPWKLAHLSTSFRVSKEVADFLNNCCLGHSRIQGHKSTGVKPRYLICDSFMGGHKQSDEAKRRRKCTVYNEFLYYLSLGYKPEDFFILAPSIRSMASPVRQLANRLTLEGIDVFVPINDEERLDERVIEGKVVFSSFHQVKGLERPVVLVFNFDDSYFKFYKSDADPTLCPNELYVALTRSTQHLSLFHHYSNNWLPFLKKRFLAQYTQIQESRSVKPANNGASAAIIETSVTDLIRHLSLEVLTEVENFWSVEPIRPISTTIHLPSLIETGNGYESVSDINGTAIPAYFEWITRRQMSIYKTESLLKGQSTLLSNPTAKQNSSCFLDQQTEPSVGTCNKNQPKNGTCNNDRPKYGGLVTQLMTTKAIPKELLLDEEHPLTVSKLLKIATLWNSFTSGYLFKLRQISNYQWLTKSQLQLCKNRVKSLGIVKDAIFEQRIEAQKKPELLNRRLVGYLDLCNTSNNETKIYELKCVESLRTEHYLQLAVYMYLVLVNLQGANLQSANLQGTNLQGTNLQGANLQGANLQGLVKSSNVFPGIDPTKLEFFLYNIVTDELVKVTSDYQRLAAMMNLLVKAKYFAPFKVEDHEFLEQMRKIRDKCLRANQ